MAFVQANLVLETTSTTGTGTIDLNGAQNSAQTFVSGIGGGNTCDYVIRGQGDWEVGRGTVTSGSPDTLSRDTVYASSNSNNKVNFGSGDKDVLVPIPIDGNGRIPDGDFGTLSEQGVRVGPIEQGTFTPKIEGETTSGDLDYSAQSGEYVRRGPLVWFAARMDVSSVNTQPDGRIKITPIPFTRDVIDNGLPGAVSNRIELDTLPSDVAFISMALVSDAVLFNYTDDSGSDVSLDASNIGGSSSIRISGTYYTEDP